ncbi:MAG: anti-sigma factor family protein [Isosphaerales bacterium]
MATRPDQLRLTPDERADLVAYIDGELPETHSRSIETKLTHSATARREVEMLEKTWELLDYLPRPRVTEQFSEKTISHIQRLEVTGRLWEPVVAAWSAVVGRAMVYLLIGGTFLALGYAGTRWVWPDPTVRLVQDLTLADHLDEYLEVGSFEFLSQLADSREFAADAD